MLKLNNVDLTKVAIKISSSHFTYHDLHQDIRLVGEYLASINASKIILVVDKEYLSYVIIWAVYLSGGTFCILDDTLPARRLEASIALFKPDMIISDRLLPGHHRHSLASIIVAATAMKNSSVTVTDKNSLTVDKKEKNNVFCILFTSGSTGEPKGVSLLRDAFEEVVNWAVENLGMVSSDVVGHYCDLGFDMGLFDVFLPLIVGATIVPLVGSQKLAPGRYVHRFAISWMYAVPTIADIFQVSHDFERGHLCTLRSLGFGGAPLYLRNIEYIANHKPNMQIYNTYGPTETTIFTSCILFNAYQYRDITKDSVCLGKPITGVNYAINEQSRDDENACMGELIVTGSHCFAGYLTDVTDMDYLGAKTKGIHNTGDLVIKKDDLLYFVGRIDNQVKVRGNRIDLDGLDAQVYKLGIVAKSLVIKERLIMFCAGYLSIGELKRKLINYLPKNHIPDEFIILTKLPLNKNGKYCKKELAVLYELKQG